MVGLPRQIVQSTDRGLKRPPSRVVCNQVGLVQHEEPKLIEEIDAASAQPRGETLGCHHNHRGVHMNRVAKRAVLSDGLSEDPQTPVEPLSNLPTQAVAWRDKNTPVCWRWQGDGRR